MLKSVDCVIVGQGLAGSWMATRLARRGWQLRVIDQPLPGAASRVASGLMTPLTGKRLVPTWRLASLLPAAMQAYAEQERELEQLLIDHRPALRVFRSLEEGERWERRAQDPTLQAYLGTRFAPGSQHLGLEMPYGGCRLQKTARIDVQGWIQAIRDRLVRESILVEESLDLQKVERVGHSWRIGDLRTPRIVFCLGHRGALHELTANLAFKSARGDLLRVRAPALCDQVHLHAGVSLTGLSQGEAILGGNYDWRDLDCGPKLAHRERLCQAMQEVLGHPLEVLDHKSAVRPIIEGRVPVLGEIPGAPGAFVLNGLASKGTMWAPSMAQLLCEVIDGQRVPDPEVCLATRMERFPRKCS